MGSCAHGGHRGRAGAEGGRGGLGIAALVAANSERTGSLANFFSYFTIESNILTVLVFAIGGLVDPRSTRWAYARGAVTLYMTITGIVHAVLLSDIPVGLASPWINDVLHKVLPLVILADWVFFPPWPRVSYRAALGWLAFPLAYFAYSLIRGPFADFYPYPFLDPRPDGYDHVIVSAIGLAVGMVALALIVQRIARQRLPAQSPAARTMSKRT
jgi:hypothetical protein